MAKDKTTLSFQADADLIAKLDAVREKMAQEERYKLLTWGRSITRSTAIRILLMEGLEKYQPTQGSLTLE